MWRWKHARGVAAGCILIVRGRDNMSWKMGRGD